MADTNQSNDKRSSFTGRTYHIVLKGDTTIRPRRASIPYTPPRDTLPSLQGAPVPDVPGANANGEAPAAS